MTCFQSARLILRTLEERDGPAWLRLMSDPRVRRFLPPGPVPTADLFPQVLQRRHELEREFGFAVWAAELTETGAFIGQCGLYPAEFKGPEVELAYHFMPAYWKQGFGSEAATAVLSHAFEALGLDEVIALVMPENVGSWRVMEKAGMRFDSLGTYYEIEGLKKYVARREWWRRPAEVADSEVSV